MIDPNRLADALMDMGVEVLTVRGDEVVGLCPGHRTRTGRPDHSPSWSASADKRTHFCFSCGYSGTLTGLVVDLMDVRTKWGTPDYDRANTILLDKVGGSLPDLAVRLEREREGTYYVPKPVPMTEARLAIYTDPPQWALTNRKIRSLDAVKELGVRWDEPSSVWILPIRDAVSRVLMGWQEKGEGYRYFKNRPTGLRKSTTLFGFDRWTGPTMLVVESPLDAVRAHSLGIPSVAVCGALFSSAQVALMRRADRLVVAFDNPAHDDAGMAALTSMYSTARAQGFDFWAFHYGDSAAKDIGDMTDEEIAWGIDHAVHSVRGLRTMTETGRNA